MAAVVRMSAKEIESHEDDTSLHFDVESDLPWFLDTVLQRTDQISLSSDSLLNDQKSPKP